MFSLTRFATNAFIYFLLLNFDSYLHGVQSSAYLKWNTFNNRVSDCTRFQFQCENEGEIGNKFFQCDNGACIDEFYKCDGIEQCCDGSDEWAQICDNRYVENRQKREINGDCEALPTSPDRTIEYRCFKSGTSEPEHCPTNKPIPERAVASIVCNPNYIAMEETSDQSICFKNKWYPDIKKCYSLYVGDNKTVCGKAAGLYDQIIDSLGRLSDSPWRIAIYKQQKTLICGGTIIHPLLVLTAADCFYSENGKMQNYSDFEVVVSQVSRNYSIKDNVYRKEYKIKELKFPGVKKSFNSFKYNSADIVILVLKEKIIMGEIVLPACMNAARQKNYLSWSTRANKLVGWGNKTELECSECFLTTDSFFIGRNQCFEIVDENFKPHLTKDKFCVVFKQANVLRGNAGDGILFQEHPGHYFIRGIASMKQPVNRTIVVFNDLADHLDWIQSVRDHFDQENFENEPTEQDTARQLDDRLNYFDKKLLWETYNRSSTGNVFLSPAGIKSMLGVLLETADGNTEMEIKKALGLPQNRSIALTILQSQLQSIENFNSGVNESRINLFLAENKHQLKKYSVILSESSDAEFAKVAFKTQDEAVELMNIWINAVTNGVFTNRMKKGDFNEAVNKLLMADYINCKIDWKFDINSKLTNSTNYFHNSLGKKQVVNYTTAEMHYGYLENEKMDVRIAEIPLKEEQYTLTILLPNKKNGITELLKNLLHSNLSSLLSELKETTGKVTLPVVTIELKTPLKRIFSASNIKIKNAVILETEGPIQVGEIFQIARIEFPKVETETTSRCPCSKTTSKKSLSLNLRAYPTNQTVKAGQDVVFLCRDEGSLRSPVTWTRGGGLPLPVNSKIISSRGRLEISNIQISHSGEYICKAVEPYTSYPGSEISVNLTVEPFEPPTRRPPQTCAANQATCLNGDCIPREFICNERLDCADGSDEIRCSYACELDQFKCANGMCVQKNWRCNGENDCKDNSDETNCAASPPDGQEEDDNSMEDDSPDTEDSSDVPIDTSNFRVFIKLIEPYTYDFNDHSSSIFIEYASNITTGVRQKLDVLDFLSTNLVAILITADVSTSQAIVDLEFSGVQSKEHIESTLSARLASDPKLGSLTASPIDLYVRDFGGNTPFRCSSPVDVPCKNSDACYSPLGRCNKADECPDRSDEDDCPPLDRCKSDDKFPCSASGIVICGVEKCNGRKDCPGGEDEPPSCDKTPNQVCKDTEFFCDNTCIANNKVCNGISECDDGTDEADCPPAPTPKPSSSLSPSSTPRTESNDISPSNPVNQTLEFKADHPFVYIIRDKRESGFLFVGVASSLDEFTSFPPMPQHLTGNVKQSANNSASSSTN